MSDNKKSKPKGPDTKVYKLIKAVNISGKIVEAGKTVKLTADGAIDFRRKNRIE